MVLFFQGGKSLQMAPVLQEVEVGALLALCKDEAPVVEVSPFQGPRKGRHLRVASATPFVDEERRAWTSARPPLALNPPFWGKKQLGPVVINRFP